MTESLPNMTASGSLLRHCFASAPGTGEELSPREEEWLSVLKQVASGDATPNPSQQK